MSNLKKYVVVKFDKQIISDHDRLEEAIESYNIQKSEGAEPTILKLITWTTTVEDVTDKEIKS